jgi:hypothetical protein
VTCKSHRKVLEDLLLLRRPVAEAVNAVRRLPWDSEEELVVLRRQDAINLLDSFMSGAVTASDCQAWADAIEGRDDVGLEETTNTLLKDFLFELSTPELTRAFNRTTAREWRRRFE